MPLPPIDPRHNEAGSAGNLAFRRPVRLDPRSRIPNIPKAFPSPPFGEVPLNQQLEPPADREDPDVKTRLSFDRLEGERQEIAVLLADDGTSINLPKRFLPKAARPGDVLSLSLSRDVRATRQLADQTKAIQAESKATDPGGDIKL